MSREAHIALFLNPIGEHPAAAGLSDHRYAGASGLTRLAVEGEAALFDAVFIADSPAAGGPGTPKAAARDDESGDHGRDRERLTPKYEPLTLLSAIATRTSRIGLIATSSTTFNEPYNLARLFASLDLLSEGRAGWNAVTTSHPRAAANFGNTFWHDHAKRYDVAEEFLRVVEALWRRERSEIEHAGEHFRVAGPLDVPPSPQGRPVISQAGGSTAGVDLGARHAEAIFTIQPTRAAAKRFSQRLRTAADAVGRRGADLRVLPGVIPYIAETDAEALEYKRHLDDLADLNPLYPLTARYLHIDEQRLRDAPSEKAFPVDLLPDASSVDNSVGTFLHLVERIRQERLTVAQTLIAAAGGRHREFVGTPEGFADELGSWLGDGAADGFILMPPATERDLPRFTADVVPVLQHRGLFRTEYRGATLREHLV